MEVVNLWKLPFFIGLVIIPFIAHLALGKTILNTGVRCFDDPDDSIYGLGILGWPITGFLVGSGVKLCNGCTSGHGVCGLPRFSPRSWVSVIVFMFFGALS